MVSYVPGGRARMDAMGEMDADHVVATTDIRVMRSGKRTGHGWAQSHPIKGYGIINFRQQSPFYRCFTHLSNIIYHPRARPHPFSQPCHKYICPIFEGGEGKGARGRGRGVLVSGADAHQNLFYGTKCEGRCGGESTTYTLWINIQYMYVYIYVDV